MKILLTGVTGSLGSHLAAALVRQEHEVLGLKRRRSDISRFTELSDRIHFVDIDDGLDAVFETHPSIELIIHTATVYGYNQEPASDILTANIAMPLRLLEWAATQGACAFINTDTFFSKASDNYAYLSSYIASKKCFLQIGTRVADAHKATFCNMRIEHMFGPHDAEHKFTMNLVRQLLDDVPEIGLTPGQQIRDFVFVDDVVDAYLCVVGALKVNALEGIKYYEIGSGVPHTIMDFATIAHRVTGSRSRLLFGRLPYRRNEIMHSYASLEALKELGWSPKITLDAGIDSIVQSLRQCTRSSSSSDASTIREREQ